jgi:hypothetical protein
VRADVNTDAIAPIMNVFPLDNNAAERVLRGAEVAAGEPPKI